MDLILAGKAILLGLIEGLTEFLPVSSTGHLIIAGEFIDFTGDGAKAFEIVIQLGAILGVAWDYRARLLRAITGIGQAVEQRFVLNLFVAFLPAAIIGLAFHKQIKESLFNTHSVAVAFIVGGILILIIEKLPLRTRINDVDTLKPLDALKIGIAQTFALIPGMSRAGATIMGGLLTGLSRTTATEFSFFLAMPVMVAATAYELYKDFHALEAGDLRVLAIGFVMSFLTALVVVKLFLRYVSRHDFSVFAWYRIVFGGLMLWFMR